MANKQPLGNMIIELGLDSSAFGKGLDGAKKAVTSSMNAMKAQMSVLSASGDQLGSLEAKYSGLQKTLQATKGQIDKLSAAYKDSLDSNGQATKASARYADQLNQAVARAGSLEKQIQQTTDKISKMKTEMRMENNPFKKASDSLDNFSNKLDKAKDKLQGWGKGLSAGLTAPIMAGAGGLLKQATTIGDAMTDIRVNMGLTKKQSADLEPVLKNAFSTGLTDNIGDVKDVMTEINTQLGDMSKSDLQKTTVNMLALKKSFPDADESETLRGINGLMENFHLSSDEAFDVFATGMQNGLDKTQEFGDNLAEYTSQWAASGYSVDQMLSMMNGGLENGAYNLDKVNDVAKEFSLRLSGGDIQKGIQTLGGDWQKIYDQWKASKGSVSDLFGALSSHLAEIKDPIAQQNALTQIWGTTGEDASAKVVIGMGSAKDQIMQTKGAMDGIVSDDKNSPGARFLSLWNDLKMALEPLGTVLLNLATQYMPQIQNAISGFSDTLEKMPSNKIMDILKLGGIAAIAGPALMALGQIAGGFSVLSGGVATVAGWMAKFSGVLMEAGGLMPWITGLIAGINWPLLAIVTAVTAVVGAFTWAYKNIQPFQDFINGLLETIKNFAYNIYNTYIKPAMDQVVKTFQNALAMIMQFWNQYGEQFIQAVGNYVKIVWGIISPFLDTFKNIFKSSFDTVVNLVKIAWDLIKGIFSGAFKIIGGLVKVFTGVFTGDWRLAWNGIKDIAKGSWNIIASGFEAFVNAFLATVTGFGNGIKNGIVGAINTVIKAISWLLDKFGQKKLKELSFPDIKAGHVSLPKFEKGSDGIPYDMYGVVNDQKGSTYREMIMRPNGETFIPQGRNVVMPLEKGTQILPAKMTKDFLPHFAGGAGEWIKNAWNGVKDFAGDVVDYVSNPGDLVKSAIKKFADMGDLSGTWLDIGVGAVKYLGDKAVSYVKGLLDSFMSSSEMSDSIASGGAGSGVYQYLVDLAKQAIGKFNHGLYISSGYRPGSKNELGQLDDHGKRLAIDVAVPGMNNGSDFYAQVGNYLAGKPGVKYVIANNRWAKKANGWNWEGYPWGGHLNHVHISGEQPQGQVYTGPSGGTGVQRWQSTAAKALQMTGQYSSANLAALMHQMTTESNGDPRAINNWDINAQRGDPSKGLMQVIGSTFRQYALPGYNTNIYDPLQNILASIRYTLSAYGSLTRGWRGVGYANGGLVTQDGLYRMGEGNKPEMVIPLTNKARAIQLMQQASEMMGLGMGEAGGGVVGGGNAGIIAVLLEQNELLRALLLKDQDIIMDKTVIATMIEPEISKVQNRKQRFDNRRAGLT